MQQESLYYFVMDLFHNTIDNHANGVYFLSFYEAQSKINWMAFLKNEHMEYKEF